MLADSSAAGQFHRGSRVPAARGFVPPPFRLTEGQKDPHHFSASLKSITPHRCGDLPLIAPYRSTAAFSAIDIERPSVLSVGYGGRPYAFTTFTMARSRMRCPECDALEESWILLGREYAKAISQARTAADGDEEFRQAADIARARMKEAQARLGNHQASSH